LHERIAAGAHRAIAVACRLEPVERPAFFDMIAWLGDRAGPAMKLGLPVDISMEAHGDWLAVKRRTRWPIGDVIHAPDSLLGIALSAFLAGDCNFTVLFAPDETPAT
jgi:prolyl oligopeptidase